MRAPCWKFAIGLLDGVRIMGPSQTGESEAACRHRLFNLSCGDSVWKDAQESLGLHGKVGFVKIGELFLPR